jgi:hypothetical protein
MQCFKQDGEKLTIILNTAQSSHDAVKIVIPSLHRLNVYRYQFLYKLFCLPGVGGWVLNINRQSSTTMQFFAGSEFFRLGKGGQMKKKIETTKSYSFQ